MSFANSTSVRRIGAGLAVLLVALPPVHAQRPEPMRGGGGEPAGHVVQQRPVVVDRVNHGSIRHVDTHVVQPRVEPHPPVGRGPEKPRPPVWRGSGPESGRPRIWEGFVHGRRWPTLPVGCFSLFVNGAPYYYNDGIYYQPQDGSYEEVYPPVGAYVTDLPDGAIAIEAGNLTYYYAGGAFYVQQDNGFVIVPTPIGVTVPELPPGAVQVSVNGNVAYQFNGIYYQPVFVYGVTQYQTFMP